MNRPHAEPERVAVMTAEALVRERLAAALGGRRGMLEGALPTVAFTATYVPTDDLRLALGVGIGVAALLVVARVLQRSTAQYAITSLVVIAFAGLIASRTGRAEDVFLPGIVWNAGVGLLLFVSILVRWPFVGIVIGSAIGDLTSWRQEPAVLRLCMKLTWLFLVPNVIRVVVQVPLYLAGEVGWLGAMKLVLGWPLYVAVLAVMVWVLVRGHTPLPAQATSGPDQLPPRCHRSSDR